VSAASFRMNQTSAGDSNAVLDFAGAGHNFTFVGTALTLDMAVADGGLIEAQATLDPLDLFGLVTVNGTFAFRKANGSFHLAADASGDFSADYLAISGNVTSAFVGVGTLGLTLSNVDFGILLVSDAGIDYTAVTATVGSATFAGLPGMTAT